MNHEGHSTRGGHYNIHLREYGQEWLADDAAVTQTKFETVSSNVYLLHYQRVLDFST